MPSIPQTPRLAGLASLFPLKQNPLPSRLTSAKPIPAAIGGTP